jgi:predicted transcriptional regulator
MEKTTRTTIRLDPELHRRLKILAAVDGTTVTALIEQAIAALLKRREKGGTHVR